MAKMSSCLSGGRAYGLELELIRSPSTSWTSHSSSSPSSTLSESSNSPVTITTRKPRTPRKRPNQTYNEAATILSTAYPKIFSYKQLQIPKNFRKLCSPFAYEVQDLLMPFQVQAFDNSGFLLQPSRAQIPTICNESKVVNSIENFFEYGEDFDAESILDEETEEGIDRIMGDITENTNESMEESKNDAFFTTQMLNMNTCYGYPVGMGHYDNFSDNYGYGLRRDAFRNGNDQFDFWGFSSVNVADITPEFNRSTSDKKKKKKLDKSVEMKKNNLSKKVSKEEEEEVVNIPKTNAGLLLKLDYDYVLNAWSDKSTPLPEELLSSEDSANDVQTRLSKIDLFTEGGGIREASVMRYKEKRRSRLFSKKIRYQVRKANADQRPRMKGRFVRRTGSPNNDHQ
ncbi:hypothetical protein Leryth_012223 [Lithospermum erythrorhizon]|uniref:CCT domain-containing protein n=1 Tax=Lithospermum erythrorhizon TaxID=34254 RepID=A0AAV3P041_LITER|nr:hypothetical protein Leryth_012223 [Lithospermum erythrorhizon]